MANRIIQQQQVVTDTWQHVDAEIAAPEQFPAGDIIVELALWESQREPLLSHAGRLGLQLKSDIDLAAVADDLQHFAVIALNFPNFRDGRPYSLARRLRQHYTYQGEIRATGEVLKDQIAYMERVGFDTFELTPEQDAESMMDAFSEISVSYQASSDRPALYQKRYS